MIRQIDANLPIAVANMDNVHAATSLRFFKHNVVREIR